MPDPTPLPATLLRQWGAVPGPGAAWIETLAPLQYVAYGLRDASGRPLGELNAPRAVRQAARASLRACPYADSRAGLPMNATALASVRAEWPWILESVRALRAAWGARHPRTPDPIDLPNLWSFSAAVLALPLFLLRTGRARDGAIPVEVAGLFKVMQGVYVSCWQQWITAPNAEERPTAEALTERVFATRILHNAKFGRVCPASRAMIHELFDATTSSPRSEPNAGEMLSYGSTYAALSLEKWLLSAAPSAAGPAVARQRDALVGWEAERPEAPGQRITLLQRQLCQITGATPPAGEFDLAWVPHDG
jgi:hypothetical protein